MLDLDHCFQQLELAKCLPEIDLERLCELAKDILITEENLQPVQSPVNVCGDIHGQFFDFLQLLKTGGSPRDINYIFAGDFVDRGYNSIETFQYLLCLKVKYPSRVTLLRGNHQSRTISRTYGFYDEVVQKYGSTRAWKMCTQVFDYLPLASLVNQEVLCVHGGLSPEVKLLDQVRLIDRRREVPDQGPFCDLLWSDPVQAQDWLENNRGAGWLFGSRVTKQFSQLNGLSLIARAHQLAQQGYQYWFKEQLVTVWSCPNYCYKCGNDAAILALDEHLQRQFMIFKSVPKSVGSQHYRQVIPYFL